MFGNDYDTERVLDLWKKQFIVILLAPIPVGGL